MHVIGDVKLTEYANYLGIIVTAKDPEKLVAKTNRTLRLVRNWLESKKLKHVLPKTVQIDEIEIKSQDNLKHLGMHLDRNKRTTRHILVITEKATKVTGNLSSIIPNIGAPTGIH